MTGEARATLHAIGRAWGEVGPPPDDGIAGLDSCCGENAAVAAFFPGRRWQDVTRARLQAGYDGPGYACLSFMSGAAFRYYIASFMVMAITEPDDPDPATEAAVWAPTPPRYRPEVDNLARAHWTRVARQDPALDVEQLLRAGGTTLESVTALRGWWEGRVEGFSPDQRAAIVAFLELAAGELGQVAAREPLAYWRA